MVVNDDLALAADFPGVGLHVGQDDACPRVARERLGPEAVLGLSTHSREQVADAIEQADVLDYFAVGPVFPTATKPDYPAVGLELVRTVRGMAPPLPFFCIGGIDLENAAEVRAAGGEGLVAVSAVLCAEDVSAAVQAFA